jgi:hypothetical protein
MRFAGVKGKDNLCAAGDFRNPENKDFFRVIRLDVPMHERHGRVCTRPAGRRYDREPGQGMSAISMVWNETGGLLLSLNGADRSYKRTYSSTECRRFHEKSKAGIRFCQAIRMWNRKIELFTAEEVL